MRVTLLKLVAAFSSALAKAKDGVCVLPWDAKVAAPTCARVINTIMRKVSSNSGVEKLDEDSLRHAEGEECCAWRILHANASSAGVGAHVPYDNWPWLQLVMFVAAARAKSATTPSAVAVNVYRM